jgi:hypothetical protein
MQIYLLIILLLVYSYFLIFHLDKTVDDFYKNHKHPEIYDLGFKYIPEIRLSVSHFNVLFLLFLIPLIVYGNKEIYKELIGYMIIIFLIRSVIIQLTVLPKHKRCETNTAVKQIGGCYDKIFSGHYAIVVIISLLYYKYNILSLPVLLGVNVFAAFLIIAMRWHYTIDVLVALFVTLLVYQNRLRII